MARARFIRPEFFIDEKVSDLPFGACMLFEGIWCHSDLRGVFEHNPRVLRGLIFPMRDGIETAAVGKWLDELEAAGMIIRFEVDGKTWGHVANWTKHQDINVREVEIGSTRPPPPAWEDPPRWVEIVKKGIAAGRINGERSPWNPRIETVTIPEQFQNLPRTVPEPKQNTTPTPTPTPTPTMTLTLSSASERAAAPASDLPEDNPIPARMSDRAKNSADLQAMHGLCLIGDREERQAWDAILREFGWDPVDDACKTLAKTVQRGQRILLSRVTAWLSENYKKVEK